MEVKLPFCPICGQKELLFRCGGNNISAKIQIFSCPFNTIDEQQCSLSFSHSHTHTHTHTHSDVIYVKQEHSGQNVQLKYFHVAAD